MTPLGGVRISFDRPEFSGEVTGLGLGGWRYAGAPMGRYLLLLR